MKEDIYKLEIKDLKRRLFNTSIKTVMLFLLIIAEVFIIFKITNSYLEKKDNFDNKIAVININKEITVSYINDLMEKMDKEIKDKKTKEFLIIMNSPGGSPSASEELSEYLKKINKIKPITMYVESIAASGGYYIASAIKPLIANKNAIVGSIGVIMPHYNIGELAKKIGVEENYIAAGKFKKPVSFFKEIDPENKKYLTNNLLTPTYENFLKAVSTNRDIELKKIKEVADGKVFIANDKRIKGILVDKISSLYEVKRTLKEKYTNIGFENISKKEKSIFPLKTNFNFSLSTENNSLNLK